MRGWRRGKDLGFFGKDNFAGIGDYGVDLAYFVIMD